MRTRSHRLRLKDVAGVYSLLGEAREVALSGGPWRQHLGRRMQAWLGSRVVMTARVPGCSGARLKLDSVVDTGFEGGLPHAVFQTWAALGDFAADPTMRWIEEHGVSRCRPLTVSRPHILPDRDWYRSFHYNEVRTATGMDDFVRSYRPIRDLGWGTWISLAHPPSDRLYDRRQVRIVKLLHFELNRMLARDHDRRQLEATSGLLAQLSPRMRQIAELLIEGLAEKQVALKLGISKSTTHTHVQNLYQRLGVTSRAEMAGIIAGEMGRVGYGMDWAQ